MTDIQHWRTELRRCLKNLAAPAVEQCDYLRALRTYPCADELALELDDCPRHVGITSQAEHELIKRLDQLLISFSGQKNEDLWSAEALESADVWKQVRTLAAMCLQEMEKNSADGLPL